ncbi:TPA: stage II sporulation protein SB, partial [Bacillus cereus]
MLYNINKRLYLFEKGREEMAEVNVKKSSFFKE